LDELSDLAALYGVETAFYDALGNHRVASEEAVCAVLRALGAAVSSPADASSAARARRVAVGTRVLDPVSVAWDGTGALSFRLDRRAAPPRVSVELALEDGSTRRFSARTDELVLEGSDEIEGSVVERRRLSLGALPPGYHTAIVEAGRGAHEVTVIAAPRRAYVPPERSWGAFLPLYALRGSASLDGGNLTDLEALVDFVGELGGAVVGTLPLLSAFLEGESFEPSPYAPVSRLFWNELFVDPARCPELAESRAAQERLASSAFADEAARLRGQALVDYSCWHALLWPVLSELARTFFGRGVPDELGRFLEQTPRARDYARFRAATEQHGPWKGWAARQRDGSLDDGDVDAARARFHLYAQLRASEQIGRAC
jgi:4-alpha-glucanotransferase